MIISPLPNIFLFTPFIQNLKEKVLGGYEITREEAIQLLSEDLQELCDVATPS